MAPPKKIGFSLGGGTKKKSTIAVQGKGDEKEHRDYLTTVEGNELVSADGGGKKGPLVIPKLENTFQVGVGRKGTKGGQPTYVPGRDDMPEGEVKEKFETADHDKPAAAGAVTYGLSLMAKDGEKPSAEKGGKKVIPGESFLERAILSQREQDTKQFKEDVEALPEEASLDDYEAMPIENFGEAMLRGMGWEKGKPVGRNAKEEVVAIEYVKRPTRLGLGAEPAPDVQKEKKYIKPGEKREEKKDLVVARDADGRQRHMRRVDEELVEREKKGAHPGKVMRVVEGRHEGLLCSVISLEDPGEGRSMRANVRLEPSKQTVSVRVRELGERWEKPLKNKGEGGGGGGGGAGERRTEGRDSGGGPKGERKRGREGGEDPGGSGKGKRAREEGGGDGGGRSSRPPRPWLMSHIKVRVVDKKLQRGALYLKKATVVDVMTPTTCEIQMEDGGRFVSDVTQGSLETVIPKRSGGRVAAVLGPRRAEKGKLLTRDKDRGTATVQFLTDGATEAMELDAIAEYVGHLDADE